MARRPGSGGRTLDLSPRQMRIAGWVVAAVIILGIALVVGLFGGDAESGSLDASPSPSGPAPTAVIVFGTARDGATGRVAEAARTNRFSAGDQFVYSVALSGPAPDPVHVEVHRTGGGVTEIVQSLAEGIQALEYPPALAFDVAVDNLFTAFGPGEYRMLIYADPEAEPIAEGTFILVGAEPGTSRPPGGASPEE